MIFLSGDKGLSIFEKTKKKIYDNYIVDEFNKTLDEFINKMILQFPVETKLKTYYSAFKVTKMYDKSMPIKIFMGGCLNFTQQIKDRDTEFFAKRETFVNRIKEASSFTDDTGLVNYWENLSDASKTAMWDYIQTLFVYIVFNCNS